jgi:hypothetical protein
MANFSHLSHAIYDRTHNLNLNGNDKLVSFLMLKPNQKGGFVVKTFVKSNGNLLPSLPSLKDFLVRDMLETSNGNSARHFLL